MINTEPKPASTVVLCRITTDWPYKILLIKRSERARFLPGAHVFPGGRAEDQDRDFADLLIADRKNLLRMQQFFPMNIEDIAMRVATCMRETLEETSLSILNVDDGNVKSLPHAALKQAFANPANFRLRPALDQIWPLSWWITPPSETHRFDTWFFLATVNETSAMSTVIDEESSEHLWLYPSEALELFKIKSIFLAPPTRTIIERMAMSSSLENFLAFVDRPLWPIEPFFHADDEGYLILPGDEKHPKKQRSNLPLYTRYFFGR